MSILAIANIIDGNHTIGLRLFNATTKEVWDNQLKGIQTALQYGDIKIDNIELHNNKIVGKNGDIDRLPKIFNGRLVGKSPLIVVNQIGNSGYTVVDFKGQVEK